MVASAFNVATVLVASVLMIGPSCSTGGETNSKVKKDGEYCKTHVCRADADDTQISGANLVSYESARVACTFDKLDAGRNQYQMDCRAMEALGNGQTVVAKGLKDGVQLSWENPLVTTGAIRQGSLSCSIATDTLSQSCRVEIASTAVRFDFKMNVTEGTRSRFEASTVLLPFSIAVTAGLPLTSARMFSKVGSASNAQGYVGLEFGATDIEFRETGAMCFDGRDLYFVASNAIWVYNPGTEKVRMFAGAPTRFERLPLKFKDETTAQRLWIDNNTRLACGNKVIAAVIPFPGVSRFYDSSEDAARLFYQVPVNSAVVRIDKATGFVSIIEESQKDWKDPRTLFAVPLLTPAVDGDDNVYYVAQTTATKADAAERSILRVAADTVMAKPHARLCRPMPPDSQKGYLLSEWTNDLEWIDGKLSISTIAGFLPNVISQSLISYVKTTSLTSTEDVDCGGNSFQTVRDASSQIGVVDVRVASARASGAEYVLARNFPVIGDNYRPEQRLTLYRMKQDNNTKVSGYNALQIFRTTPFPGDWYKPIEPGAMVRDAMDLVRVNGDVFISRGNKGTIEKISASGNLIRVIGRSSEDSTLGESAVFDGTDTPFDLIGSMCADEAQVYFVAKERIWIYDPASKRVRWFAGPRPTQHIGDVRMNHSVRDSVYDPARVEKGEALQGINTNTRLACGKKYIAAVVENQGYEYMPTSLAPKRDSSVILIKKSDSSITPVDSPVFNRPGYKYAVLPDRIAIDPVDESVYYVGQDRNLDGLSGTGSERRYILRTRLGNAPEIIHQFYRPQGLLQVPVDYTLFWHSDLIWRSSDRSLMLSNWFNKCAKVMNISIACLSTAVDQESMVFANAGSVAGPFQAHQPPILRPAIAGKAIPNSILMPDRKTWQFEVSTSGLSSALVWRLISGIQGAGWGQPLEQATTMNFAGSTLMADHLVALGNLIYVGGPDGTIRSFDGNGRASVVVGPGRAGRNFAARTDIGASSLQLSAVSAISRLPDGGLLLADPFGSSILEIASGTVKYFIQDLITSPVGLQSFVDLSQGSPRVTVSVTGVSPGMPIVDGAATNGRFNIPRVYYNSMNQATGNGYSERSFNGDTRQMIGGTNDIGSEVVTDAIGNQISLVPSIQNNYSLVTSSVATGGDKKTWLSGLNDARGLAIPKAPAASAYVALFGTSEIKRFDFNAQDSQGSLQTVISSASGLVCKPVALRLDSKGRMYVLDNPEWCNVSPNQSRDFMIRDGTRLSVIAPDGPGRSLVRHTLFKTGFTGSLDDPVGEECGTGVITGEATSRAELMRKMQTSLGSICSGRTITALDVHDTCSDLDQSRRKIVMTFAQQFGGSVGSNVVSAEMPCD